MKTSDQNLIRLVLIISISILTFYVSFSQQNAVDINNIQKLNVDELTDAQIQEFIKKVEESGYTEDQLVVLAQARGLSQSQISKLKSRMQKVKMKSDKMAGSKTEQRLRESPIPNLSSSSTGVTSTDPFGIIIPEDTIQENELKIFGLEFFNNKESQFKPSLNIPTPENYELGPGDEIIIDIWGAFEYTYSLNISPDGFIKIEDVGPIQLAGLSIDEATIRLNNKLKTIYSSLGDNAFSKISLGQLRTINVNVVGEVQIPGTYTTSSFESPFNILYRAGGPTEIGSLRKIEVIRKGKLVHTLDAYDLLLRGKVEDFRLMDEDVVLAHSYLSRASIVGEVKRPAIYELTTEETLEDLIHFAGGFTGFAFKDRISLRRNSGNFRSVSTATRDKYSELQLRDGDYVEVKKISNLFKNRVTIEGAVFQSGEYQLDSMTTLSKLIEKAGGLRGDAFAKRVIVLRKQDDYSLSSVSLDLANNEAQDFLLRSEDYVKIQSIYDIREGYFVQVQGEVQNPGKYPFIQGQSVEDLILLSGGFKESAAKSFVEVARRSNTGSTEGTAEIFTFDIDSELKLSQSDSEFELNPFDLVAIRKSPNFEDLMVVELDGEVLYPGKYVISRKDEKISDLIVRAGGLSDYAYENGARLIRRTEYYESGNGDETSKIRRQELESVLKRDTIESSASETFKTEESIGIDLVEILNNPGSEDDLILKDGDLLNVPRELQTVRVRGQVLYPSNVRYSKNYGFKDFISQAGGFTDQAAKKKAYVLYPNGTAERTESFLWFKVYPVVTPGSEIILPSKPEKKSLSAGEIISLGSGLGTLALVINNLIN